MKLTKYGHSCLLIEDNGQVVLVDPGIYSWDSQTLTLGDLRQLDYLFITHQHSDHFHLAAIKSIVQKFPGCRIITNPAVAGLLNEAGLASTTEPPAEIATAIDLKHADLPWDHPAPNNTGYQFFGRLLHPGDSLELSEVPDILALPVTAPWGSFKQAFELAKRLKPKIIIPIHDWQLKDEVRTQMIYERSHQYFKTRGSDFVKIQDGATITL